MITKQELQSMVWQSCQEKNELVENFAKEFHDRLLAIGLVTTGMVSDIRLDRNHEYDIRLRYTFGDGCLMVVWPPCANKCQTEWRVESEEDIIRAFEEGKSHHSLCPKQPTPLIELTYDQKVEIILDIMGKFLKHRH